MVGTFAVPPASAAGKCEPEALPPNTPRSPARRSRSRRTPKPYAFRDPEDFDKLIGLDAELVRASFGCIGVPFEFKTGSWSGLLPSVIAGQADLMWSNLYYTITRRRVPSMSTS